MARELVSLGAKRGKMMGRLTLSVDRRMFVCLDDGAVGFRLGGDSAEHAAALALPGARIFSPGRASHGFADWVALPVSVVEEWEPVALQAFAAAQRHVD
jgi:hypothetical protein